MMPSMTTSASAGTSRSTVSALTNGSGASGIAVAEHTLMLMLALIKRLPETAELQRQRRWVWGFDVAEVHGQTACIVGLGDVGRSIAHLLGAFGVRCIGVRRRPEPMPGFAAVATSVGAAGVVTGLVVGGIAKSNHDESLDFCVERACRDEGLTLQDEAIAQGEAATVVFTIGAIALATGAMLLRLGDRVMQLGSTAVAGFTTFVVGGVLAGQVSGFVIFENPVWDRRGIVIGVGGLAVLALHLVSLGRRAAAAGRTVT